MDMAKLASKRSLVIAFFILVGLIFLFTFPYYNSTYTLLLLTTIFMHIILTTSWTIFSGPTAYISLAPAAFFGVGIYTSAMLGKELPFFMVIIIAGLASSCLALIVGGLTLRLRGIYFAIFTFGLVALIKYVLLWYEINMTGTRGRFVIVMEHATVYRAMLVVLLLTLLCAYLIKRSKFGFALQSIGEEEVAAAHIGINVTLLKVTTFGISALFMGAAGAIMATRWTYIDPYIAFDPNFSFMPVLMAIFGGMGQLYGPILGATIFALLEEALITRFPYYYMLLFGIILVVSVLYLPMGLVGLIQKWRLRAAVR